MNLINEADIMNRCEAKRLEPDHYEHDRNCPFAEELSDRDAECICEDIIATARAQAEDDAYDDWRDRHAGL